MRKLLMTSALLSFASAAYGAGVDSVSIEAVKTRIASIATENQARIDNYKDVRAELEPLVKELVDLTQQTVEERIVGKVGVWQQLWTDDGDDTRPNNFFSQIDRTRTFQVVDSSGFFYNISEIETALNLRLTAFLRGEYQREGNGIGIRFTNLDIKALGTKNVADVAYKLETKKEKFFPATKFAKYPKGPVGAEGFIDTVYVDEQLRIDYGYNKADGVVDLFVLKRI